MDKELKDEETRNWVKTCLALRYVTEGIVSYVKKACEEKYLIDIDHLKDVCGISDYTCNMCNVKELKPYHARLFPCKYQQYIRRCGCQGQNKKTCLQNDICGVFYDLIIDNHVKSNPKWSNTKCELWSDQRTGPWEVMKCYICTPGYEKKPDIFQADVTALVQICMNDRDLQTRLGYRLVLLEKIREIRNEVCHSATMQMSTDCFKQHVRHMKDVLRLDIFKGNKAAKDGRKKLKSLKKEAKQVTVEDEMNAREDTIAAIKELKKLIEQSEDSHEIARQKIAHLTSVEDKHKRELEKQFDEITSHLQDLKKEIVQTTQRLDDHKCMLSSIYSTLSSQNEQQSFISRIVQNEAGKVLKPNDAILKVLERIERKCDTIANPSFNQIPFDDIKLKLVIEMNDKDEAMISAYVVESANGIKPNVPRTQLQQCLETALNKLKEGFDVKIHEIKHKCVAIHLGFPTLKRWLEFLHGYFNGDIGNIFVPLQEHLRYLCFEDLEFTVVVYEKDFIKCSQAISVELDTLSCGKILHFEHEETEKSPVRVEETTFGTASENFDLRNEYAPGELETPDTAPENDPDQTVRAAEQETPSRLRAKGTNNYHSSSSSSIDKVGEQDTSSRVWTIETSSEYADNKC